MASKKHPLRQMMGAAQARATRNARLVPYATAITETSFNETEALVYQARKLVQTTLPHSDPGDSVNYYSRRNGRLTLTLISGQNGLPYGVYPRLLMLWITREAVRTQKRELHLGESLRAFMAEVGIKATGGEEGTIARFKEQLRRLVTCFISLTEELNGGERGENLVIVGNYWLRWDEEDEGLDGNVIKLSNKFFQLVTEAPVPLQIDAVSALRRSPLSLDLYAWVRHRLSYAKSDVVLTWTQLSEQFGSEYGHIRDFRRKAIQSLKDISFLWPEFRFDTPRGRLRLYPAPKYRHDVENRAPRDV